MTIGGVSRPMNDRENQTVAQTPSFEQNLKVADRQQTPGTRLNSKAAFSPRSYSGQLFEGALNLDTVTAQCWELPGGRGALIANLAKRAAQRDKIHFRLGDIGISGNSHEIKQCAYEEVILRNMLVG